MLGVGVVRQLEAAHEFAKAALDAPETLLVISLLILGGITKNLPLAPFYTFTLHGAHVPIQAAWSGLFRLTRLLCRFYTGMTHGLFDWLCSAALPLQSAIDMLQTGREPSG